MDNDVARQIAHYLDEILDLSRDVAPPKLKEIRARVEVIKAALGGMAMVQDPNTGTGQQLGDYLPEWDRPTGDIAADKGLTEQEVEAVKVALENGGLTLKHPSDPKYHGQGWHKIPAGQGLPADWEDRLRKGEPLT